MNVFLVVMLSLFLTACAGPLVNVTEVNENQLPDISVFTDPALLRDDNVKVIGTVNATSCKHLLWEEDSSVENCVAQMKVRASALSADGIVMGGSEEGSANFLPSKGINRNCWNTVDCSGTAIIFVE